MIRAFLLLLFLPLTAAAAPRLFLDVRLDPGAQQLNVAATLADPAGLAGFSLSPAFEITSLTVDGRRLSPEPSVQDGRAYYPLPPGSQRVSLAYQGALAPLVALDHRQVLAALPAMASEQGSFLPAGSGWYPHPGTTFAYHLRLDLPKGQKGLVPGDLVRETDDARGYRAAFDFPHPAEGIDLMVGPYTVAERPLTLPSGRQIKVRTWFHADLAKLAPGYLEDSAAYIARYSRLIGDYPFGLFSVVSSPLPTGFGMPSLTYLGREVLKLPFIRATSLGHEVLHNWWGNGVYPDWQSGNWSEGLTTFLADYAYKEDQGEAAAREARLGWLRDLAAVPPAEDTALKDFVARQHGISSIVGYNKAAMVFLMLRDLIGRDAFEQGLRRLWASHRFRTASWSDLEAAFVEASGRPLADFFRQWVDRAGAPAQRLEAALAEPGGLKLRIAGAGDYALRLPLRLVGAERSEDRWLDLASGQDTARVETGGKVEAVELDPDYRLWRRLDPAGLPAILREVFVAPKVSVIVADGDEGLRTAAYALAERVLDAAPSIRTPEAPLGDDPLLVVGTSPALDAWLAHRGLPPRPAELAGRGSAQVWASRDDAGRPVVAVAVRETAALQALQRGLPHYGRQGWLVFDGARAVDKGTWPPRPERVPVQAGTP